MLRVTNKHVVNNSLLCVCFISFVSCACVLCFTTTMKPSGGYTYFYLKSIMTLEFLEFLSSDNLV